jgi:hypothetical protein
MWASATVSRCPALILETRAKGSTGMRFGAVIVAMRNLQLNGVQECLTSLYREFFNH